MPNALKVRTGSFYRGSSEGDLFIIRNGSAVKSRVRYGAAAPDEIEILRGAAERDEEIHPDMSEWGNVKQVNLK